MYTNEYFEKTNSGEIPLAYLLEPSVKHYEDYIEFKAETSTDIFKALTHKKKYQRKAKERNTMRKKEKREQDRAYQELEKSYKELEKELSDETIKNYKTQLKNENLFRKIDHLKMAHIASSFSSFSSSSTSFNLLKK